MATANYRESLTLNACAAALGRLLHEINRQQQEITRLRAALQSITRDPATARKVAFDALRL